MKLIIATVSFGECIVEAYNRKGFYAIRVPKEFIDDNLFYYNQKIYIKRKYFLTGDLILGLEGQKAKYKCAFLEIKKLKDISSALVKLNNQ